MRRLRLLLIWTAVIAVVLAAGLVLYLRNADLGVYQAQIEKFLSARIGHRLDIDGRFKLQVRGETVLIAESLRLANSSWPGETQLLAIGDLSVSVDTWSIFAGPLVIRDLQVGDIDLRIERDVDGRSNWSTTLPTTPAESSSGFDTDYIAFRNVELDKVTMSYRSPQRTRPVIASIDRLRISPNASDVLDIDLSGAVNELVLSASGSVGPWQNLLAGEDIAADLDAGLGDVVLAVRGSVDDLLALTGVEVNVDLSGPSIERVSERLGLPVFAYGAFELGGSVSGSDSGRQLNVSGNVGDIDLFAKGTVDNLRLPTASDFDVRISGPNVAVVAELFNIAGAPQEPFEISGECSFLQTTLKLSGARVRLGANSVLVDGWLDTRKMPPEMDVTINAAGPDFSVFTPFIGVAGVPAAPFDIDGRIRSDGSDWQFDDVEAIVGANRVFARGAISPGADTEIVFRASGPDNSFLHAMTGLQGLPARPYDVSARIRPSREGVELADARASFGDHQIAADGVVAFSRSLVGTMLSVSASGPELQNVALLTGVPYLPTGPYDVSARIAFDSSGLTLDAANASVGPLRATASGSIGLRANVGDFDLAVSAEGPDLASLARFEFLQRLSDEPFSVSARVSHTGNAYEIKASEAKVGTLDALIDGWISDDGSAADIAFRSSAPDAQPLSALLGIAALPEGAFSADGSVEFRQDELELTDTSVQIGGYRFAADGALSVAPMSNDSDLQFSAAGPDLERLLNAFDIDVFPAKPFTLSGEFRGTPSGFAMREFAATIGENDVDGVLTANLRGKPTITGTLSSTYLDLSERLPQAEEGANATGPAAGGLLFPDEPLDLDPLRVANAQVAIRVDELILDESRIEGLGLDVMLNDGNLSIAPLSFRSIRGNVDGSLELKPSNGDYELITTLDISGGRLGFLSGEEQDLSLAPELDGTIELSGSGHSLHQIMASSNGTLRLRHGPGRILNTGSRVFGDVAMQLLRVINPLQTEGEFRRFDCGIYDIDIVDGVATLETFAFQTDRLTTVASGNITFEDESISIAVRAKPREGIGISVGGLANSFVKVGGTIKSPQLILDSRSAATATGAAVATGGLSLLGRALWDRVSATADICAETSQ